MAYVEWHDTVRNHFKTEALMIHLKIKRREAVGIIGCLSSWAIQFRPGGIIERELIPIAVDWDGDPEELVNALIRVRWLDDIDNQQVAIHDWDEITRGYRKGRVDAERRKAKCSATDALQTRCKRAVAAQNRTEQNRTEQSREENTCGEPNMAPPHEALRGLSLYEKDGKLNDGFEEFLGSMKAAYPGVNLQDEIKKAHAWELSNPERRKVRRKKFLNNWFARRQDAGRNEGRVGAAERATEREPKFKKLY